MIRPPINLGAPQMSIGGRMPTMPMQRSMQQAEPASMEAPSLAAALGRSAGASGTPTVESGSWVEALAAALEGGLHGRAQYRQTQRDEFQEQDAQNREQKQSERQQQGYAAALAAGEGLQGAERDSAMARALASYGQGEPAFDLATREQPERWSEPFDQGGVQVQRSSTTNQMRPVGNPPANMIFQAPAGYRGSPDALEPIPGGPADVRQTAEGRARVAQLESSDRQLTTALEALDSALPQVSGWSTGLVGQVGREFGGTPAFNLNQALEPVRAILSFETLAEMRRNSTTGGALGSIAVRELELLGNVMVSLNTAQGEEQVRSALTRLRAQLDRARSAVRASRAEFAGEEQAPPEQPAAPGPQNAPGEVTTGLESMSLEQLQQMREQMTRAR